MNHSAFTYLVGPGGQLRSMYREGIDGATMAAAIRRHLEK
jgi:cytochrome oxidase Cu insertion factor (SCO1/SenC/PrrC family)